MGKHQARGGAATRRRALVAGALTTGVLIAGATGPAPMADASCLSISGFDLGRGCKSAPLSLAIGVGSGATAHAVNPFTFVVRTGPKVAVADNPLDGLINAVVTVLKGLGLDIGPDTSDKATKPPRPAEKPQEKVPGAPSGGKTPASDSQKATAADRAAKKSAYEAAVRASEDAQRAAQDAYSRRVAANDKADNLQKAQGGSLTDEQVRERDAARAAHNAAATKLAELKKAEDKAKAEYDAVAEDAPPAPLDKAAAEKAAAEKAADKAAAEKAAAEKAAAEKASSEKAAAEKAAAEKAAADKATMDRGAVRDAKKSAYEAAVKATKDAVQQKNEATERSSGVLAKITALRNANGGTLTDEQARQASRDASEANSAYDAAVQREQDAKAAEAKAKAEYDAVAAGDAPAGTETPQAHSAKPSSRSEKTVEVPAVVDEAPSEDVAREPGTVAKRELAQPDRSIASPDGSVVPGSRRAFADAATSGPVKSSPGADVAAPDEVVSGGGSARDTDDSTEPPSTSTSDSEGS